MLQDALLNWPFAAWQASLEGNVAGPGYGFLGDEERLLVSEVLTSWELSRYRFGGDDMPSKTFTLEREVQDGLGAPHCLALNSGTSALLAALVGLGVGPGDEVVVPGYTFIATVAAVVHRGAVPVLAEVDDTLTLDPKDVERRITPATRAIIAVHMLGAPCDLAALREIAGRHGLHLIEDVAQACGGRFRGQALGTIGDAGAFSLNLFKVITAGDGGWLTVRDTSVYERAFAFHDHGFVPHGQRLIEADTIFGMNLRMTELTAAVALGQFRKLERILDRLRYQRDALTAAIADLPGCVKIKRSHDVPGDCCTSLTLQFTSAEEASTVASQLGTKTLAESGRHHYRAMAPLLARRGMSSASCPFSCPAHPHGRDYEAGMLPRTDDWLSRSLALSVGVSDTYLGTGFGITVHSDGGEIKKIGKRVRDALSAVTGNAS